MPLDDALPPSRLPDPPAGEQIVSHFSAVYEVQIDLDGLEELPASERLSLAGARLPEPPEAHLLDRVLQIVPPMMRGAIGRIVLLDSRAVGRYGTYRADIVRVVVSALHLREGDPEYGGRYSFFVTTVLHEIGHAVFAKYLTAAQRAAVTDQYLDRMAAAGPADEAEPTERGAEHHFIALFMPAILGAGRSPIRRGEARRLLEALGIALR